MTGRTLATVALVGVLVWLVILAVGWQIIGAVTG